MTARARSSASAFSRLPPTRPKADPPAEGSARMTQGSGSRPEARAASAWERMLLLEGAAASLGGGHGSLELVAGLAQGGASAGYDRAGGAGVVLGRG